MRIKGASERGGREQAADVSRSTEENEWKGAQICVCARPTSPVVISKWYVAKCMLPRYFDAASGTQVAPLRFRGYPEAASQSASPTYLAGDCRL